MPGVQVCKLAPESSPNRYHDTGAFTKVVAGDRFADRPLEVVQPHPAGDFLLLIVFPTISHV